MLPTMSVNNSTLCDIFQSMDNSTVLDRWDRLGSDILTPFGSYLAQILHLFQSLPFFSVGGMGAMECLSVR